MKKLLSLVALSLLIQLIFVGNAFAGVDDFRFSSFNAEYYLSKDSEGRSFLKVIETLTAEFPSYNQNKGIVRAIPIYYDGHKNSFELLSLTRNGVKENVYSMDYSGDFVNVGTGTGEYLTGTQKYQITYTLRDVVKSFDNQQEFYWDVNGNGWSQYIDKTTATVYVSKDLLPYLTGDISCYQGAYGSNLNCDAYQGKEAVSFSSISQLPPRQTVTINLVFKKGTFSGYKAGLSDYLIPGFVVLYLLMMLTIVVIKFIYGRDAKGRGIIIPEYLPPKDLSLYEASFLIKVKRTAFSAQLIDLAVKRKVQIIEEDGKGIFKTGKEYSVKLLMDKDLSDVEKQFLLIVFDELKPGSVHNLSKKNMLIAGLLEKYSKQIEKSIMGRGLRENHNIATFVLSIIYIFMIFGAPAMLFLLYQKADLYSFGVFGLFFATGLMITPLIKVRPLTNQGREIKDYLLGLKMYIKLAEADRIKYLQSPDGAERIQIDTNNKKEIIKLYEKVLPYAILFGIDSQWSKILEQYYKDTSTVPVWYVGSGGFNFESFSSSVSSFSNYSNSSSYSSSSGGGGGGFAGGGGGGGGGGGR